jgi:hypothetical protein
MNEQDKKKFQFQVQLDEQTAQGSYCNMSMVNHTPAEFTLDFAYVQPQQPRAKVRARIIMSPLGALRFSEILNENIRRYEERFGKILIPPNIDPEVQ